MAATILAVLFDFDGVLVDSEPLHFKAFQSVAAEEKILLSEEEYFRELIGFDDRGAFAHLFAKHERVLDAQTFGRVLMRKSDLVDQMMRTGQYAALPGAVEFVRSLQKNYPLAICSGALRGEIETMLKGIGLRECFDVIVSADDVTIGKPDPQGYFLAAQRLGEKRRQTFAPANCLIVEDAPSVIASVRAVGFPTLAVATSYPAEDLAHANFVVRSLRLAEVRGVYPTLLLAD